MKIEVVSKKIDDIKSDMEVVFVLEKNLTHKFVKDCDILDKMNFKAKSEEVAYLPEKQRIYVGVDDVKCESLLDISAVAIKQVIKTNAKTLKIATYCKNDYKISMKFIIEGMLLGAYRFDKYLSKKDKIKLEKIFVSTESYSDSNVDKNILENIISESSKISKAVSFTRDIVNSMPDEVTPKKMASIAQELSKTNNLKCKILNKKAIQNENMNALLAVSRASTHPPRVIHLTYTPKNPKAKIVLVGKGLTYDSGGLSLKPSDFMVTMKSDKSGACAVLGILKAVSELGLDVEVHGVIGAVENMIGGNSYKPDDILIARNNKTIEVRNTDAEGRLVLADCLDYACDLKPDYLIDMATLTGACVVALGEYTSGIMGFNEDLKDKMLVAAEDSGELASKLPFNKYLKKLLKSNIADISNISSSRYGGAITAGLFLSEFVRDEYKDKWLHIDIAGPAFVEKEWGCNPFGGSGAGVRMVVEWLKSH